MTSDPYASDRAREAAAVLRLRASRATPGPWRLSPNRRYSALVADRPHPHRRNPESGGWGWDDAYDGCLIAESVMTADRVYLVTMSPAVGFMLADILDAAADGARMDGDTGRRASAALDGIADVVLGVLPPSPVEEP